MNQNQAYSSIQKQTWFLIIPTTIAQLFTGFAMISLHHYDVSELWIKVSVMGFIIVLGSWFGFIYILLLQQQMIQLQKTALVETKYIFFRRLQLLLLVICVLTLLVMIFFMTNKSL